MKRIRLLAILNLASLIIQILFSYLTQFKIINTRNVGEVTGEYGSLFSPAPLTFSIWILANLTLSIFCVYHLFMAWRERSSYSANQDLDRIGGWFILTNLLTTIWLVAWTHHALLWSIGLLFLQLDSLLIIQFHLNIYDRRRDLGSKLFTQFPLSIYFAWISFATIACISTYLSAKRWSGWGLGTINWTMIMIGFTVIIAVLVVLTRKNVFFGLVFIWALYGIILKREEVGPALYFEVIRTAWLGISIVGFVCVLQLIRNSTLEKPTDPFPVAPHSLK